MSRFVRFESLSVRHCAAVRSCALTLCVVLCCVHHVDFLRIARSWICTNGRHSNMTRRSGDLHQHDADDGDEGPR